MTDNPQGRRWNITINNPLKYGFTHEVIIEKLHQFSVRYFCIADEIGEEVFSEIF